MALFSLILVLARCDAHHRDIGVFLPLATLLLALPRLWNNLSHALWHSVILQTKFRREHSYFGFSETAAH